MVTFSWTTCGSVAGSGHSAVRPGLAAAGRAATIASNAATNSRNRRSRRRLFAIGEASEEGVEQAPHVAGALPGDVEGLRMAERGVAEADGEIRDGGDGGDAQAAMARDDRLRHGRHADGVDAEPAIGADLRRRLKARPEQRQ